MSSDRPVINHEGRAQDHSGARNAAASAWGRPEGSHLGSRSSDHVGQPGGSSENVGRPGPNANHIGRPGDSDARANAAIQEGLKRSGDIYKSSFDHMGSPYPDGGTTGGMGSPRPDAGGIGSPRPDGAGGMGSSRPDGTVGAGGMGQRPEGAAASTNAAVDAFASIGGGSYGASRVAEPLSTTAHVGEEQGFWSSIFSTADGKGTAT